MHVYVSMYGWRERERETETDLCQQQIASLPAPATLVRNVAAFPHQNSYNPRASSMLQP